MLFLKIKDVIFLIDGIIIEEKMWAMIPSYYYGERFGTKSQQALQLQREENKLERKVISREMKEAEKRRQFEFKQQKRKEKHRGR